MATFSDWWNPGVWYLDQAALAAIAAAAGSHLYSYGRKQSIVTREASDDKRWNSRKPISEPIRKVSDNAKEAQPAKKQSSFAKELPKPAEANPFKLQPLLEAA